MEVKDRCKYCGGVGVTGIMVEDEIYADDCDKCHGLGYKKLYLSDKVFDIPRKDIVEFDDE